MATTAAAIRDRISALITALTPTSLSSDAFRETRNEYGADFRRWAMANKEGALRRFQVRNKGDDETGTVTNTTEAFQRVTYEVAVAYPQTHRYGDQAALDRDDVIEQDSLKIQQAIGQVGYGNFTGANPNAFWDKEGPQDVKTERLDGVDFLAITISYRYWRAYP